MTLTEFLFMGGYYPYVWPAITLTLITMALAIYIPIKQHKTWLQQHKKQNHEP